MLREFEGDMNRALSETEKFLSEFGSKTWCSGAALAVVHITPKVRSNLEAVSVSRSEKPVCADEEQCLRLSIHSPSTDSGVLASW